MKWTVAFAACLAFVSAQNATLPYSSQNTTAPAGTTAAAAKTTASPPTAASKEATVNSYNVTVPGTNHTCIMVEAAMQVKVVYATKDGQVKEAVLPLDNETVVDPVRSSCTSSSGEQTLVLLFGHNNILSLVFAKNGTVYLHKLFVEVFFSTDLFPGAVKPEEHLTVYNDTLMLYSVPEDRSYYCKVDQPVYVGANVTVDVLSAQLQAFRNATAEAVGQFGAAVECSAGDISNIVPIAVGSALAALVIIVLIAYLIGRSKSRQKGYQSV
ncbi:lysosome-associated membrane glycoprotein 1 [Rhipicephalus microplus]|uniref:Lysosome-associated membrane glycoprotein 5 n=1 Tax=Rhipicephalus microplus TaxID=6941 RepID=A0A6M2CK89_RHIMP